MKPRIDLITLVTKDVPLMVSFYRDVLGFETDSELEEYVEFHSEGVRFAICSANTMEQATGDESFRRERSGQAVELAFPVESPQEVDRVYADMVEKGAVGVKGPGDMPWGQRAAFFADPDGNIHEIFANLGA